MRLGELAIAVGVPVYTLRRLIWRGVLKAVRYRDGAHWRISMDDLPAIRAELRRYGYTGRSTAAR